MLQSKETAKTCEWVEKCSWMQQESARAKFELALISQIRIHFEC